MLNLIAEFMKISADTIITLCICGGIIALCIFLMVLMRKRPPKDDRVVARKQCEKALEKLAELKKSVQASDFVEKGKINTTKLIRTLNYAKRLANQVVYESENSVSAGILDNVQDAREVAVRIKKGEGVEACVNKINYCENCLNDAVKIIDDIIEADKQINKR